MGFEVHFKYYKKKAEGFGYDTEGDPEVMKVAVGKQWDDVDLDEVAKACFGQMAKRNILIVDAEIYEYTKKKVSFKLKDDGISIKNRKFSYDITGAIKSENDAAEMPPGVQLVMPNQMIMPNQPVISQGGHVLEPHEIMQQQYRQAPPPMPVPVQQPQQDISHLPPEVQAEIRQHQMVQAQQHRPAGHPAERMRPILPPAGSPLRFECYDPHPDLARVAAQKRLPFTVGKRYPIYEEKPDRRGVVFGMIYVTEDDQGNRRALNDKHFVPLQNLSGDFDAGRPNHVARVAVEENQVAVNGKVMQLPDIYTLGRRR